MKKVLVTGGAGYIGSVLVRLLLENKYQVRVFDSLMFGGNSLIDLFNNDNFDFYKGDIRNEADLENALTGVDYVVHLAAIVGDPACAKQPDLARSTNFEGSQLVYSVANRLNVKRLIFSSTCSNYGKMEDPNSMVDENSTLSPVSLYAETKVQTEKFLLSQPKTNYCKPVVLRFSTVYGLSQRPRFDLTVNEFTKELALGRELVIFGEQFWRPYCHVIDLARSVMLAMEAPLEKVEFNVFNVGDSSENYQKKMIVDEVLKFIPDAKIKYVQKNEDPRDYRVSFEKIKNELGFSITKKVPDGIAQILKVIKEGIILEPDNSQFKNI
ncbi:MAG: NAD(P)-dependent oxidoreductase [Bacteroidales bacterium]|nr:MAG: NAD(P)-dependent oxidoreductase [Bacteroidales bacterium]